MNIHYAHLCEKAFLSQNGNLNLIGIFENLAAQQFPISFPQLSIVTALEGEMGEHEQVITIVNVHTNEELLKPISLKMNVGSKDQPIPEGQKPGTLRIIGDINNLTIKEPGDYEVRISLDGEQKYTIPFKALKANRPIPEGR